MIPEKKQLVPNKNQLMIKLSYFKQIKFLCDLQLQLGDVCIICHACIVAAASPVINDYLRALEQIKACENKPKLGKDSENNGCGDMLIYEIKLDKLELKGQEISESYRAALNLILSFIYGDDLPLTDDYLRPVYELSVALQLQDVAEHCLQCLEAQKVQTVTALTGEKTRVPLSVDNKFVEEDCSNSPWSVDMNVADEKMMLCCTSGMFLPLDSALLELMPTSGNICISLLDGSQDSCDVASPGFESEDFVNKDTGSCVDSGCATDLQGTLFEAAQVDENHAILESRVLSEDFIPESTFSVVQNESKAKGSKMPALSKLFAAVNTNMAEKEVLTPGILSDTILLPTSTPGLPFLSSDAALILKATSVTHLSEQTSFSSFVPSNVAQWAAQSHALPESSPSERPKRSVSISLNPISRNQKHVVSLLAGGHKQTRNDVPSILTSNGSALVQSDDLNIWNEVETICPLPGCDFHSSCRKTAMDHVDQHKELSGICCKCDMVFVDSAGLLEHKKEKHTCPKPYWCPVCEHRMKHKSEYKQHLSVHSDERPFQCSECGLRFKSRTALYVHGSIHTKEKTYMCSTCGYTTRHRNLLRYHERLHTGNVLKCPEAGCSFFATRSHGLKKHMMIHTDEKSYQCSICGHNFRERKNLTRHQATHTKERSHACPDCDYSAARKDKLKEHRLKKHGIGPVPKKKAHTKLLLQLPETLQSQVLQDLTTTDEIEPGGMSEMESG